MNDAGYENHLAELRRLYVEATPRQRYSIALQRISNPGHGPNVLIACVSAVEGLARSLAMHRDALARVSPDDVKAELSAIYPKYRRTSAEDLIAKFLAPVAPADYFGAQTWKTFLYAVEYRNVLAHECTYLGRDRSPALITCCAIVLNKLAAAGRLEVRGA